jgi:hypothetical protein
MSSGENGCPNWWEIIMTNHLGEQKVEKNCGYQQLPQMIVMMCKQTEHTTYAAYDMRNKVVENVGKVIQAVHHKLNLPDELLEGIIEKPLLEDTKQDEST